MNFWPGDWRHRARCQDVDGDLFFPVGTTGPADAQIQAAKAICALCPVIQECRQWALNAGTDADFGIWGGLDEAERREIRTGRRLARDRHGTVACYLANGCRCEPCKQAEAKATRRKRQREAS